MNLNEPKNVMIDIEWANLYTEYLMGAQDVVKEIDNSILKIKIQEADMGVIEDEDYVMQLL